MHNSIQFFEETSWITKSCILLEYISVIQDWSRDLYPESYRGPYLTSWWHGHLWLPELLIQPCRHHQLFPPTSNEWHTKWMNLFQNSVGKAAISESLLFSSVNMFNLNSIYALLNRKYVKFIFNLCWKLKNNYFINEIICIVRLVGPFAKLTL